MKPIPALAYQHVPALVLWVFLAFVVFRYLQGGYRYPVLGEIRFEAIVGSVLLLAAIFLQLGRKRHVSAVAPPRLAGWVSALLLLMVVHVATSVDPGHSWNVFIDRVVKFGLFGFMIFSFVTSPLALRLFLCAYLLSFMRMTYEGIVGYFTGSMVWENQGIPRLHGATPSYAHPNSLGGTQLSTLPFVVSLWPISPRWVKLVLAALGVGALLVSIFTGSRTAYLALGVWLAFLVWRAKSRFRALVLVIVGIALISPFIPSDYYDRFATIFTQQEKEGASMETRQEILEDSLEVFMRHPFGVGVAAFPTVRYDYFGRIQDTHNLYLEVATNLGFPGLIVFLGLVVALFRSLSFVRTRMDVSLERLRSLESGLEGEDLSTCRDRMADLSLIRQTAFAVTGFLIIRLVLGLFGHDLYEIYWWFMIGLTAALVRMAAMAELRAEAVSARGAR